MRRPGEFDEQEGTEVTEDGGGEAWCLLAFHAGTIGTESLEPWLFRGVRFFSG